MTKLLQLIGPTCHLFCETCECMTPHTLDEAGKDETYTCAVCLAQQWFE